MHVGDGTLGAARAGAVRRDRRRRRGARASRRALYEQLEPRGRLVVPVGRPPRPAARAGRAEPRGPGDRPLRAVPLRARSSARRASTELLTAARAGRRPGACEGSPSNTLLRAPGPAPRASSLGRPVDLVPRPRAHAAVARPRGALRRRGARASCPSPSRSIRDERDRGRARRSRCSRPRELAFYTKRGSTFARSSAPASPRPRGSWASSSDLRVRAATAIASTVVVATEHGSRGARLRRRRQARRRPARGSARLPERLGSPPSWSARPPPASPPRSPAPAPARAPPPAQLGPAREVLRRRRERLRRQPRRLHGARSWAPTSTTCSLRSCSFLVAVTNNYTWNRLWTFRGQRGHVALPGAALLRRLAARARREPRRSCDVLVALGVGKVVAQAIAIVLVTPINFVGNKLWSFRRNADASPPTTARSRPPCAALLRRGAATTPTGPVYDGTGNLVQTPFVPAASRARLTEEQATAIFLARPEGRATGSTATRRRAASTDAEYDAATARLAACSVWWGDAGQIATGKVDDRTGHRDGGLDRAAGRLEDGARRRRRVRRQDDQQPLVWLGFCARLPARPRRPAPAALAAQPRPARAALVLGLALVLQPRATSSRACRSPTRRSSTCSARMVWIGGDRARRGRRARSGRSGCSPPRPSSSPASGSGSTSRRRT